MPRRNCIESLEDNEEFDSNEFDKDIADINAEICSIESTNIGKLNTNPQHKHVSNFQFTSVVSVLFWLGHWLGKIMICLSGCCMALGLLYPRYASFVINYLMGQYEHEQRFFRNEL